MQEMHDETRSEASDDCAEHESKTHLGTNVDIYVWVARCDQGLALLLNRLMTRLWGISSLLRTRQLLLILRLMLLLRGE